jgi:hypothetical protein
MIVSPAMAAAMGAASETSARIVPLDAPKAAVTRRLILKWRSTVFSDCRSPVTRETG